MIMTANGGQNDGFSESVLKLINAQSSRVGAAHFLGYMKNPYDKVKNPKGYVSFGIAENTLSFETLKEKLDDQKFIQSMAQYSEFGGMERLKEAICQLYSTKIIRNVTVPLLTSQVSIGAGCTPLLENMFRAFCEPGEIVLIPSPMYGSFSYDAFARFGVKVVPVPMEVYKEGSRDIEEFRIQIPTYEQLYQKHGNKIKMILICNPNNPTGHIISRSEIQELISWSQEKSIHLVSDEIYALSIFTDEGRSSFESIYDICEGNLGNKIHIISGFSKDFCLNGYRCGYVYSQNPSLTKYLNMTSAFYLCSNQTQSAIASILMDSKYLDRFIETNQMNLKESYEFTVGQLKKYEIPFIPSSSGLFLAVDLRKCLSANTPEAEMEIWDSLYDDYRVIINPGKSCDFQDSGYFRFIFTTSNDNLEEGIKRIGEYYKSKTNKK